MYADKSLVVSLLISMLFHVALFLPLPYLKHRQEKKNLPALKINYLTQQQLPLPKAVKGDTPISAVKPKVEKKDVAKAVKETLTSKPQEKPEEKKVAIPKPKKQKAKIEIPPELPKEKEKLYLEYYQLIRQRIRRFVVNNYPRYVACGEICLYFGLSSDGMLKEIKVVQERSSNNDLLKEIAKKSVLQASPFSPFPGGLSQPQLSFNVIISFELEK